VRSLVLALLVACAPTVDGPIEHQRTIDRVDGEHLQAQLVQISGVVRAEVILHRATVDPLAKTSTTAASSLVIVVDDRADRAHVETTARSLAHAIAPEIQPTIAVEVGAHRADLATVGPFTVEAGSKGPLKATLALALAIIAGLAGWAAWLARR
jgi:hypothetical protein